MRVPLVEHVQLERFQKIRSVAASIRERVNVRSLTVAATTRRYALTESALMIVEPDAEQTGAATPEADRIVVDVFAGDTLAGT